MVNLNRLKKDEILWLYNHKCKKHGHRYTEHITCYEKDKPTGSPIEQRIGILDIEASNLKATFGIVFSYAIKLTDGTILGRAVTPQEMRGGIYDKKLLQECVKDLKTLDVIVGYFSSYYDIPFLRSRCLHWGIEFPLYKEIKQIDLFHTVKRKLCLHRNRLSVACELLGIPAKGHPIKTEVWLGALSGRKRDLDYILTHNIEDVDSTLALYNKLLPYMNKSEKSI